MRSIGSIAEQTIYATILGRQPLPVHPTTTPNLSLVPSHILLSNTDIELTTAIDHREARLKTELDKIVGAYEGVPVYFELDSIVQISKTIREVQHYFNQDLELLGFLFNSPILHLILLFIHPYAYPAHAPTGIFSPARMGTFKRFSQGVNGQE